MKPARRLALAPQPEPGLRPVDGLDVYPASAYLAEHWALAVAWLRNRPGGSKWILDTHTERKA